MPNRKRSFEEVRAIVESCRCSLLERDFHIRFERHPDTDRWFLQVGMERQCAYTGERGAGFGGKLEVSPWSTRDEIVKKILGACLAYAEHEVREGFFWKDHRLFNPHVTVEALARVCGETLSRDEEVV